MTRKIDYFRISETYDNDKYRKEIPLDVHIKAFLEEGPSQACRVLDVACGTGNYLATQIGHFSNVDVEWYGLDASEDMLAISRKKASDVTYVIHDVEKGLPYESESFDFVINNFAFHQFENRDFVLSEINRVLRSTGMLKMRNAAFDKTPSFWMYRYFPSTRSVDKHRYWPMERLYVELEKHGFKVEITLTHRIYREPLSEMYKFAVNKDASHYALISDTEYQRGVETLSRELEENPEGTVLTEFALMDCVAMK